VLVEREITRVEELASRLGVHPRRLERLFHRYVGLSPRWVIKRVRLYAAAEAIARAEALDWPDLAQELGYFDQAHFIRDFKAAIGRTPGAYARDKSPL
jgi:AraC-like DNA-binding protein